jgi:hypothetical protein
MSEHYSQPGSPFRDIVASGDRMSDVLYRTAVNPFPSIPGEFARSEGQITLTFWPKTAEAEVLVDALMVARGSVEENAHSATAEIEQLRAADEPVPPAIESDRANSERHLLASDEMRIRLRGGGFLLDESGALNIPRPIEAPLPGSEQTRRPGRLAKLAKVVMRRQSEPSPEPEEPPEPRLDPVVLTDLQIEFVLDDLETAIARLTRQLDDVEVAGDEAHTVRRRLKAMEGQHTLLLQKYTSLGAQRHQELPPE